MSLAIRDAQRGDREALTYLYVQFAGNVYGYVRSIVGDSHEAEDLTQHVFAKLIFSITQYEDRGVAFLAWLLRLARNAALDHLRARRPTPAADDGTNTAAGEELAAHASAEAAREHANNLYAAFHTLPEQQRSVVIMRHVLGLTPGEIARQLGRSESSVHGLHHRGRRALATELERLGSAPSVAVRRR